MYEIHELMISHRFHLSTQYYAYNIVLWFNVTLRVCSLCETI